MYATSLSTTHWVVVSLSREIEHLEKCLGWFQMFDCWAIDLEDFISTAIFQLNSRDRPLIIDHLLNQYDPNERGDDTLCEFLTLGVQLVYDRLSPIVPGNMDVQEYTFVGDDIMIGGKLF